MKSIQEIEEIKQQLKSILKQKKLSYKWLANEIKASEVTVKRFFTSDDMALKRLNQICGALGISTFELFALISEQHEKSFQLNESQEEVFSKDDILYRFYTLLLNHRSIKKSCLKMGISDLKTPKLLKKLNQMNLIVLPVDDRVQVKHQGTLTWLTGGPLQKKHMRKRHLNYLESFEDSISNKQTFLTSSQRSLTEASISEMKQELSYIAEKFRARAYREEKTCSEDQLKEVAWLLGLGEFEEMSLN